MRQTHDTYSTPNPTQLQKLRPLPHWRHLAAGKGAPLEVFRAQANQVDATYTRDIAQAALQRAIGARPK